MVFCSGNDFGWLIDLKNLLNCLNGTAPSLKKNKIEIKLNSNNTIFYSINESFLKLYLLYC